MNDIDSKNISDLKYLSHKLDAQFRLPLGLRVGWDGILGFIPGVGDFITTSFAFYILLRAAMLGCPLSLVGRMGINVLIETVVDMIPLVGNIFDLFWKANLKNVALLDKYLEHPIQTTWASRIVVFAFLLILSAIVIGFFVVAVKILAAIWELATQSGAAV